MAQDKRDPPNNWDSLTEKLKQPKGKAKAQDDPPTTLASFEAGTPREHSEPEELSSLARIANSASSLTSEFAYSAIHDAKGPSSALTAKAGPASRNHTSTWGEASRIRSLDSQAGSSGTFKAPSRHEHVVQEENAFAEFLQQSPMLGHPERGSDSTTARNPGPGGQSNSQKGVSVGDYSKGDGMDVARLLESGYDEVMVTSEELVLSGDDARTLRRALFGDGGLDAVDTPRDNWENLLNFMPPFLNHDNSSGIGNGMIDIDSMHFGATTPQEAKELWLQQWHGVLTKYTDEVWGDLDPLVQQALAEVQQVGTPSHDIQVTQLKALHRLQQVLIHLRGR